MAMFDDALGQVNNAYSGLNNAQSAFSGINNAADLRARFGIPSVAEQFAPLYKSLAASSARNLQNSVMRAGRSATPGETFSNVDLGNQMAKVGLQGQQGAANAQQSSQLASLLGSIGSANNQFNLGKYNELGQLGLGAGRLGLEKQQMDYDTAGPNFWSVLAGLGGTAAKGTADIMNALKKP